MYSAENSEELLLKGISFSGWPRPDRLRAVQGSGGRGYGGGRGEIGVSVRRWAVFRWEVVPEMAGMWPNRGIWGGRIIGWERSFPGRGAKRFLEAAARSSQDGGRLRVTRRRERRSGRRGGFLVAARGWIGRTAHDVTVLTLGQYLRPPHTYQSSSSSIRTPVDPLHHKRACKLAGWKAL